MRLLTNNPKKIAGLEGYGLSVVERVPLEMPATRHNVALLRDKRDREGHMLRASTSGQACTRETQVMPRVIDGQTRRGARAAQWPSWPRASTRFIVDRLVDGAVDALVRHGVGDGDITVVRCPGAFEIPQVAKRLADGGESTPSICLGCVIRGATPHFDYVAGEAAKGIAEVAMTSARCR